MSKKKFLLPYGDPLREFLRQPGITRADIKLILRRRGVFFSNDDKEFTVPLLIKTGLSPYELEELIEKIRTKEDNPKVQTQSIPWSGGDRKLLDAIPPELDIQQIVDQPFTNYKVVGAPNFKAVDGDQNHIEMEFLVERNDLTKSWDQNVSQFNGKITLKKDSGNVDVSMSLNTTSTETKFVADKISKNVIKDMKSQGVVDREATVRRIRFNDFTNENRIRFLNNLIQSQLTDELYFRDIKDIGFRPDIKETLPEDISWMEDKIKNLVLQGSDLQGTFFVKDKSYHKYLEVYRMEAEYSFEYEDYSGECRIKLEFSDLISRGKTDSELSIRVESLKFATKSISISTSKVKELLLYKLEASKLQLHDQLRQPTA